MSETAWAAQVIDIPATAKRHKALAASRWLRRLAAMGMSPEKSLRSAEGMEMLAEDIERNPDRYRQIPEGVTDWDWFHSGVAA